MTHTYTDIDSFPSAITLLDDGDDLSAMNLETAPEGLANRTRYLYSRTGTQWYVSGMDRVEYTATGPYLYTLSGWGGGAGPTLGDAYPLFAGIAVQSVWDRISVDMKIDAGLELLGVAAGADHKHSIRLCASLDGATWYSFDELSAGGTIPTGESTYVIADDSYPIMRAAADNQRTIAIHAVLEAVGVLATWTNVRLGWQQQIGTGAEVGHAYVPLEAAYVQYSNNHP